MQALAAISGIGLVILWLVGLGRPDSAVWLTWLDGAGAVLSFIVAASARSKPGSFGVSFGVSLGLFALWIIGLETNGSLYQDWWTFVFACLMGIAAIIGASEYRRRPPGTTTVLPQEETKNARDRFRRSA